MVYFAVTCSSCYGRSRNLFLTTCAHSVCENCAEKNSTFECIHCFDQPTSVISKLGKNNPSVAKCVDCRAFICHRCLTAHQRIFSLKKHTLYTRKYMTSENIFVNLPRILSNFEYCTHHTDQEIDQWCEDCSLASCLSCVLINHSSHKTLLISKAISYERYCIERSNNAIMNMQSQLLENLKIRRELSIWLMKVFRDNKGEVEKYSQELHIDKASVMHQLTILLHDDKNEIRRNEPGQSFIETLEYAENMAFAGILVSSCSIHAQGIVENLQTVRQRLEYLENHSFDNYIPHIKEVFVSVRFLPKPSFKLNATYISKSKVPQIVSSEPIFVFSSVKISLQESKDAVCEEKDRDAVFALVQHSMSTTEFAFFCYPSYDALKAKYTFEFTPKKVGDYIVTFYVNGDPFCNPMKISVKDTVIFRSTNTLFLKQIGKHLVSLKKNGCVNIYSPSAKNTAGWELQRYTVDFLKQLSRSNCCLDISPNKVIACFKRRKLSAAGELILLNMDGKILSHDSMDNIDCKTLLFYENGRLLILDETKSVQCIHLIYYDQTSNELQKSSSFLVNGRYDFIHVLPCKKILLIQKSTTKCIEYDFNGTCERKYILKGSPSNMLTAVDQKGNIIVLQERNLKPELKMFNNNGTLFSTQRIYHDKYTERPVTMFMGDIGKVFIAWTYLNETDVRQYMCYHK